MSDGFHVDVDALKDAGLGLADLLGMLDELKVEDIDCDRSFIGHTGLADSYVIWSPLIVRGCDLAVCVENGVVDAAR